MTKVSDVKKFLESFPDDAEATVLRREGTPEASTGTFLVVRDGDKSVKMKMSSVREIIN